MAFPFTPQDIDVELSFDSGTTWSSIVSPTNYVYREGLISIDRGRKSEANDAEPAEITMTLKNNDGRFTPDYPLGAYYGSIGRNSQIRVSLPDSVTTLRLPGDILSKASCPDSATISVTGDLDVRADVELLSWRDPQNIVGKWEVTSDERSWNFQINSLGQLVFTWSSTGAFSTIRAAVSTVPVDVPSDRRLAVRATIDVDNGAAGRTITFYTSTSISGTWTQLGDAIVQSGTTSIADTTASIEVGSQVSSGVALESGDPYNDPAQPWETADAMTGKVRAVKVLSGIAGTEVANPDFTAQTAGATSFSDTATPANTWTVGTYATIDDRDYRAHGEVTAWPQRWDTTGTYVAAPIAAGGLLRRMNATGSAASAKSAIYRFLSRDASVIHYWPCEEAPGATAIYPDTDGTPALTVAGGGNTQFGATTSFECSDALPTNGNSEYVVGGLSSPTGTSGYSVRFLLRIDDAGTVDGAVVGRFITDQDPHQLDLVYNTASGGTLKVNAYNNDGTLIGTAGATKPGTGVTNNDVMVNLYVSPSGSDVEFGIIVYQVSDWDSGISFTTKTTATTGKFTNFSFGTDLNLDQVTVGHISIHNDQDVTTSYQEAYQAHVGERAGRRFERICDEESIRFQRWGSLDSTMEMGPQNVSDVMTTLTECQDADGGLIYEPRDFFGIGYRTRTSLYNQPTTLNLDYVSNEIEPGPEPTDDDRYTMNDATVQRLRGSSPRYQKTSGTLNVNEPGTLAGAVGRYAKTFTLNLNADVDAAQSAGWLVHLRTVDEQRWPSLSVNLANSRIAADTTLVAQATRIDIGERLTLTNMPIWIPQQTVDQLVFGCTETLGQFERELRFDCAPANPWQVGVLDDAALGKLDTAGTELVSALTTTATSAVLYTTSGPEWTTDAAQYSFGLKMSGEEVTATACTSGVSDAFGRTSSNGWGSADIGGAWTNSGGSASDYSVGSGYGVATLATVDVSRRTYLTAPGPDTDTYCDITTSALATGASLFGALTARYVDIDNMYMARLEFTTANAIVLVIRKVVAGAQTSLGTYTLPNTHVAGTFIRIRFKLDGTSLKAKGWLSTADEPPYWQIDATDSSFSAAGNIGTRSITVTGNTNVNPQIRYDNLETINPQIMTITRSVNGIVKAQSAGTAVSLADPMILAL